MKTMQKSLALLLAVLLLAAVFSGVTVSASAEDTRTVVDVWNREVEIPNEVRTIVCLGSMGPRFAAYLDAVDMMVGAEDLDINNMSARFDYSPVYHDQLKELPLSAPEAAAERTTPMQSRSSFCSRM